MSKAKHTPAHAAPADAADDPSPGGEGAARGPLATALRELSPPRHGPDFWDDLDRRLADEPQLRLAPRSAIRPITQPPPVIDDSKMAKSLKGTDIPSPPRPSSRRTLVVAALAALVLLVVVAAIQAPDDDADDTEATSEQTGSTAEQPAASDQPTTPPTTPAPTLPPGTIDPAEAMAPGGVGPLTIGSTMGELQAAGLTIQPDDSMFRASGGRCYVARVQGALDLRLRFRGPDEGGGADEPTDGVLAAVSIESGLPTARASNTAIALGTSQNQILAVYGANLDDRSHPFVPDGRIVRADNGDGNGIAFMTDGAVVIGIAVGEMDVIRFVNECG